MTDHERDPLEERLRQALPTDVPGDTRARHLAALDASLTPRASRLGWRHRLGTTLAAAAAALTPVGVAVAAEGSIPGDLLYPVKQATEQVQALVRDEVVLEHRVDELDRLLDRDAEDDTLVTAVERGIDAAVEQPDEPELQERMSGLALEAASRIRDADTRLALDRLPTRRPAPERPMIRPTGDPEPADRPTARPTTEPSTRPNATATPRPVDSPSPDRSPTPTDAPSPRPSPSPLPADRSPTPSPKPSPEPTPAPEPTPDRTAPLRTERHEARDAGVVFIDVYRDGIRLAGVRPRDAWEHRVDRSREPEALSVVLKHGDRTVWLFARWVDGEVRVTTEERTTSDAPNDGAPADAR